MYMRDRLTHVDARRTQSDMHMHKRHRARCTQRKMHKDTEEDAQRHRGRCAKTQRKMHKDTEEDARGARCICTKDTYRREMRVE